MPIAPSPTIRLTLVDELWPGSKRNAVRLAVLALAGTAILTVSAKIQIPFYPIPLTLQTLAVLVLGMAYGWRLGAATMALYLVEGAVGLPVFAGTPERGIGLAYMGGPTGGYLAGFVLATLVVGYLAERGWDRSAFLTAVAMLVGNVAIYLPGVLWLGPIVKGYDKAISLGVLPFLYGDAIKLAVAVVALPVAWRIAQRLRG